MFCSNYVNEFLSQGIFAWCVAMHTGVIVMACVVIISEPIRVILSNCVSLIHRVSKTSRASVGAVPDSLAGRGHLSGSSCDDSLPADHYRGGTGCDE